MLIVGIKNVTIIMIATMFACSLVAIAAVVLCAVSQFHLTNYAHQTYLQKIINSLTQVFAMGGGP